MPHRRERFERSDVPRESAHRNLVALAVLLVLAAGLAALLMQLWRCANADGRVGDAGLGSGISTQAETLDPDEGYEASDDVFTHILVLTVDDVRKSAPTLQRAQLLSLDATKRKGYLVEIPLDVRVEDASGASTLQELFAAKGAQSCIAPLAAACNIRATHVLVATDELWDQVRGLRNSGVSALLDSASGLFSNISTDMSTSQLLDVVELVQSIGVENLDLKDAPTDAEDDGDGGSWSRIRQTELGLLVGTLRPTS